MAENLNYFCMSPTAFNKAETRAAIPTATKWNPGDPITIRFLSGAKELQDRVRSVALEWLNVANLNFQFVKDAPSDVRIAFMAGSGSWSYIGTNCRSIDDPDPTMNYGWLTPTTDDTELRRVVLHEFGHAIGLIHEHQNPDGGIKWNKPAVIHDLGGPPNNWDAATIETNMFQIYSKESLISTSVDPKSIMMYPIPKAWTLDGFSAGLNSEISDMDRTLVKSVYPR